MKYRRYSKESKKLRSKKSGKRKEIKEFGEIDDQSHLKQKKKHPIKLWINILTRIGKTDSYSDTDSEKLHLILSNQ